MPYILLRGHFSTFEEMGAGAGKRLVGHFTDGTGWVDCVWFKGLKYILNSVDKGREYLLFGKPTEYQYSYNIPHPELEASVDEATDGEKQGLSGLYNTTEKMKRMMVTSKVLQRIILTFFKRNPGPFSETLPAYITEQMHLMQYNTAIRQIHFPANPENLRQAQYRFKFEELFYLELYLVRNSKLRQRALAGFQFARIADFFNHFYTQCLPFELTGAQKRVLKEIRADVGSGRQMNRLLQGDVGSGKTLVAVLTMLMALDNGFQACLMAPTEILATQHYENLLEQLTSIGVHVALLTGSTPKKQREKIHTALADGTLHILIGTHALIEPTVQFKNLGMVVIDEQHRFGVKQRSLLWQKNVRPPHVLVMTATPIPRTLAMTVYGDLEVSVIDELPPGRKPIQTLHRFDNQRLGLNKAVRSQLQQGRQAYVVYPLIEENEKLAYRNVEEGFRVMQEAFPEYHVVMVHGKMKPKEKEAAMQQFVTNEAQIMVATTVIEVGVNVPNASVMIIESAERFGLSQLHQLRGRVGRGADQSYCVLVTNYKLSEDTRKRMEIMCSTTDGFEIAEADLKMRGPGDLEGTQQSGLAFDLRIANLARDGQILTQAREMAQVVIERDSLLEASTNRILRQQLDKRFSHTVDWSRIS
jgi:ATP-dependent DNA helicase RecG